MQQVMRRSTADRLSGRAPFRRNGGVAYGFSARRNLRHNLAAPEAEPDPVTGPPAVPTLGIVTALPVEFAAMHALLDRPWPYPVADDPADYAVGTLPSPDPDRPHTVVLTRAVEPGGAATAAACAGLIRSFRTVSVVVMVGVAAGVPAPTEPTKHVRLGDIVVACWGVVDGDHVEATSGRVHLQGCYPRPSPLLSRAANLLRVEELHRRRTPWLQWLDPAGRPELREHSRPDGRTDVLPGDGSGTRIHHPHRVLSGHGSGLPKVHYGLIGSADRTFRDGRVRAAMSTQYDLRAVELPGTGIADSGFLNGLEWFVVRGVSDYGDGRASRLWRPYAALTAASYTRSLLAHCPTLAPRPAA
jgi:nucleoside phosphorylase